MKQIITTLSILLLTFSLSAQDKTKFQSAMEGTLKKMEIAKTSEDYQSISNTLGRIGANEPTEWAPTYYATFIKTFQAFEAKDKAAAAAELALLSPKMEALLTLENVSGDVNVQSEINTLLAMMYSARMMENPMALAAKFSPLNAQHLRKAIAQNANNPRAYMLQAQSLFYTPEAFGGDKAKAKELAQKSLALFTAEEEMANDNFMPRWGKGQIESLLKQMK